MCKDYLKKAGHRFRQGQPQWLFNQSQLFSSAPMAKAGAMAALSSPNGHFIKASPVWPLCQEQPNCNFIKASPNGNFIKQVEWQVELQFSSKVAAVPGRAAARFQLWRANPILRRASNLSTDNLLRYVHSHRPRVEHMSHGCTVGRLWICFLGLTLAQDKMRVRV